MKFIYKILINILLVLINLSCTLIVEGQLYFTESIEDKYAIKVSNESKDLFQYPWAGGMNSCQFGVVDMNLDGIKDLFVFDRHGDRIMTFINGGSAGTVDYEYAPEYIDNFPELFDWAILVDYNNDGKEDIFTYSGFLPGIIVYKNISETELEFELEVYPYLESLQGNIYTNILVTDVDYPGISDIDNDGDLDILTFWGLGAFVEMHKNMSMENYGVPDSLDYEKTTSCWGYFAENDESNIIYLDTCLGGMNCQSAQTPIQNKDTRHTGSTFLLLDLDADNDKDLVLGDVDYPNLIELVNDGNPDSAYMISQDTAFPSYNKPVNLISMPVVAYIDINNNEINDLILSPFDPGLATSRNKNSVWLYFNDGANNNPQFEFEENNFLQNEMIDVGSGAYPVFEDYNGDGLFDLFVSNYGYYIYSYYEPGLILTSVYWSAIALFQNVGDASDPEFQLISQNFEDLQSMHLTGIYPTFGDLDGDNDKDMIIGDAIGTLKYFENQGGAGEPMDFDDPVENYAGIEIGAFSTPQLFDLNKDGLLDLIIGEEAGNLNYYENTGSISNPDFTFVTDSLGKVNVTDPQVSYTGYSTPYFFGTNENETNLVVGSEAGEIFYYKNIDGNLGGSFEENDSLYLLMDDEPFELQNGIRTAATLKDLNNDGYFDLLVGNYSGGLNYYPGIESPGVSNISNQNESDFKLLLFPNPARNVINVSVEGMEIFSPIQINIYNIMSEKVDSKIFSSGSSISVAVDQLADGIYICELAIEKDIRLFERFIISR